VIRAWIRAASRAMAPLLALASCVSTVTPPEDPIDAVTVHPLSTGRHAGLLCSPSPSRASPALRVLRPDSIQSALTAARIERVAWLLLSV
jgi:hypothetical protein